MILRHARSILPPPTSPARGRIPPCVLPLSQCTPSQFLNLLPDIHGAHESQLTEEGRASERGRERGTRLSSTFASSNFLK